MSSDSIKLNTCYTDNNLIKAKTVTNTGKSKNEVHVIIDNTSHNIMFNNDNFRMAGKPLELIQWIMQKSSQKVSLKLSKSRKI